MTFTQCFTNRNPEDNMQKICKYKLCTSTTNVQMLHTHKNTLQETFLDTLVPLSFFTSTIYTHIISVYLSVLENFPNTGLQNYLWAKYILKHHNMVIFFFFFFFFDFYFITCWCASPLDISIVNVSWVVERHPLTFKPPLLPSADYRKQGGEKNQWPILLSLSWVFTAQAWF